MDGIAIIHRSKLDGARPEFFHYILQSYTQFFDPSINTLKLNGKSGFVIALKSDDDMPVGCIIYEERSDDEWYIIKSFTTPEYRGNGINAMLFSELKAKALQKGISQITSHVSPKNEAMIKALEKSGREIVSYVTSFKIEEQ